MLWRSPPRRRRVGRNGPAVRVSSPGGAGLAYIGKLGHAHYFDTSENEFGEPRDTYFTPVGLPFTIERSVPAGGTVVLATVGFSFGSGVFVSATDTRGNDYSSVGRVVYDRDDTAPFDDGNLLSITLGEVTSALFPGDTITPFWQVGGGSANGLPSRVAAYAYAYVGVEDDVAHLASSNSYASVPDDDICTVDALWGQQICADGLSSESRFAFSPPPEDPVGARLMFSVVSIDGGGRFAPLANGFDHWKTEGYETLDNFFTPGDLFEDKWNTAIGHRLVTADPEQHDPGGCWGAQPPNGVLTDTTKGMVALAASAGGAPGTVEFGSPLRGVVGDRRATVGLRPQTQTPAI